jgi:cytokinin riboside 5'-monophosphate phosphoribohydrolase
MNLCIYCSSSNAVDTVYFEAARRVGHQLAARGDNLIYGGADIGLMGTVARAVSEGGGHVTGVMPEALRAKRITYDAADRMIITRDMRTRKATMARYADAFIALPGGFGTLEELAETLTERQLQIHEKPVVILNVHRFYDPLIALFEHFYREQFARRWEELYHVADTPEAVFAHLDAYAAGGASS